MSVNGPPSRLPRLDEEQGCLDPAGPPGGPPAGPARLSLNPLPKSISSSPCRSARSLRDPTSVRVSTLAQQINNYYYFPGRCGHVVWLTKFLSLLYIPIYFGIWLFFCQVGPAVAVLFSFFILFSVGASFVYGAFTGSRLCLIPFIFLQIMLLLEMLFLTVVFLWSALRPDSYMQHVVQETARDIGASAQTVLLLVASVLAIVSVPMLAACHIVWLDYEFISEIDETLEFMRDLNEQKSKSDL